MVSGERKLVEEIKRARKSSALHLAESEKVPGVGLLPDAERRTMETELALFVVDPSVRDDQALTEPEHPLVGRHGGVAVTEAMLEHPRDERGVVAREAALLKLLAHVLGRGAVPVVEPNPGLEGAATIVTDEVPLLEVGVQVGEIQLLGDKLHELAR